MRKSGAASISEDVLVVRSTVCLTLYHSTYKMLQHKPECQASKKRNSPSSLYSILAAAT